ncbi:hypothetical protein MNB_SM-6-108 [hydrothermal vent metagenome]|uniref:Uncharacterized protein n=1 Tax=hydrothermal vent metagenome TaxID=652676 RepID=A0A1W1C4N9_9ZZZZ
MNKYSSRGMYQNSWIVSTQQEIKGKIEHNYFCQCSHSFRFSTTFDTTDAPDVLCPLCGNDYFINSNEFGLKDGVRIWKDFHWEIEVGETADRWSVTLFYTIALYNAQSNTIIPVKQNLLTLEFDKEGKYDLGITYHSNIVSRYSLFQNGRVKPLSSLLLDDAKEQLINHILNNRVEALAWINRSNIESLSYKQRFEYIRFFLKNNYLQEHRFFFWKMEGLEKVFTKTVTQKEALQYIANEKTERIVKKALYRGYEESMQKIGYYYPYSDYIFSRIIKNVDLLANLYALHPAIKQNLFTSNTLSVAIELLRFLKRYYTEKQIVNLFTRNIQDEDTYRERLLLFRDTLNLLDARNAIASLEKHFMKIKLTTKKLHDEIIRIFHIVSYELDAKEEFEYDPIYLSACQEYEGLEFRLPLTARELSLWAKMLHNCMFGYIKRIHQHKSIIYGIFKDKELLYAIELNGFNIVQPRFCNRNKNFSHNIIK